MGQEGGQLDLAVHGGSEAGPAVHGCAPVHRDHGGAVAAQAHTALQNLVVPTQLQGDRRQQHQALLTDTCSLFTSWGQTALSPGAATPSPGQARAHISLRPGSLRVATWTSDTFSFLTAVTPSAKVENKSLTCSKRQNSLCHL